MTIYTGLTQGTGGGAVYVIATRTDVLPEREEWDPPYGPNWDESDKRKTFAFTSNSNRVGGYLRSAPRTFEPFGRDEAGVVQTLAEEAE